ncbi:tetracycline resistance protein, class A-like isoform X2 [Hordeum vulgare subsp. vulgare]|uniref:tetracycline resistance protein, class A-like isoform X2 n=1 Tax=Hordeum vulgare subsp. vulgare TaxID=112509 RepID=UPI000B466524|nr:tetracycline resistance protein, class A-like isoform X2 [Hordeum vulgare subsp. vulgare]
MKEAAAELGHLLVFAFLFCLGAFMVVPVITDVTMAALCPGEDQCSLAIYLTGLQQAITGLGALVVTPVIGNLSDRYGRKALLALPATLSVVPLAIMAFNQTRPYFYAFYVAKTLTAMVSEGAMMCLSLAYVADKVPEGRRAAAFGVFSGVCTAGFVGGTIAARFLSVSSTFQVATLASVAAAVYLRAFVQETDRGASLLRDEEASRLLFAPSSSPEEASPRLPPLRKAPSLSEMATLLTSSSTFTRAAVVTFFHSLGETGLQTALLYFLKAQFHYTKNQYANLLLIIGITGSFSQLTVMPLLAPKLGEKKLLVVALTGSCVHGFLYSIAWSFWVPYLAASCVILSILIRSIVSKKVGPSEQGMVQGCITGISSTASVISPLVFTPLTAWFLSETAPFNFKGFSLACAGFATLVALTMSINMRPAELQTDTR